MVEYVDLNAPPKKMLAQAFDRLDEQVYKVQTRPAGVSDLGLFGDVVWTRTGDGREISIRDVDAELEAARERIDQAVKDLEETDRRLGEAEGLVDEVRDQLDGIDWEALGADVYTEGPPPMNPTIGKALWVAPSGRVFRAVECEEQA